MSKDFSLRSSHYSYMDSVAPIFFLDVDGVVNAFPKKGGVPKVSFEYVEVGIHSEGLTGLYPIHYRPDVVEFINTIHNERFAEVRWLTTWGRHAQRALAPQLGLDRFEVAGEPPDYSHPTYSPYRGSWWKLRVITDQIGDSRRKFIFADDDLSRSTRTQLRERFGQENVLLVTPFETVGIDDLAMARIRSFLRMDGE